MKPQKRDWYYFDEMSGEQMGPVTLDELDAARKAGSFEEHSYVTNTELRHQQGPRSPGIRYSMITRLGVEFAPTVEEFHAARIGKPTTVLSGPNNCGKTLLLKQLFFFVGQGGYTVAVPKPPQCC